VIRNTRTSSIGIGGERGRGDQKWQAYAGVRQAYARVRQAYARVRSSYNNNAWRLISVSLLTEIEASG
jgi:hypothetical protein